MIAHTGNHGFPILIADILISAPGAPNDFSGPTWPGNVFGEGSDGTGDVAKELRQKIVIINDRCCIALAGDVRNSKLFFEDFAGFVERCAEVRATAVQEFIDGYGIDEFDEPIEFIILIVEKEGKINLPQIIKYGKWDGVDSKVFGEVVSLGAGAQDYLKAVIEYGDGNLPPIRSHKQAVRINHSLIASLMTMDNYTPSYRINHWGGGIEMVFFDGKKFKQFSNISYLFAIWTIEDKLFRFDNAVKVIYYGYLGDILVIVTFEGPAKNRYTSPRRIKIVISPLSAKVYVVKPFNSNRDLNRKNLMHNLSFRCDRVALGCRILPIPKERNPMGFFVIENPASFSAFYGNGEIVINHAPSQPLAISLDLKAFEGVVAAYS